MDAISQTGASCGWIPLALFYDRSVAYNALNNFFFLNMQATVPVFDKGVPLVSILVLPNQIIII